MSRLFVRRTSALSVFAAALLAVGLGGCGSSNSSATTSSTESTAAPSTTATTSSSSSAAAPAPAGAAQVLKLAANPSGALSYDTTSLTAKPGKVTIEFTNASPLEHDVTVATSSGAKVGATPIFSGGTKSVTIELKAGTYTFFCSVPGHRQAGMQGTLTVG